MSAWVGRSSHGKAAAKIAGATPYLGRTSTGWIAPACGWRTHSITSSARASRIGDRLRLSPSRAKKGATGGKHDHRSLPAAGVIAAVGSIYFAWRNREFRKFLAGRSSCHRVFCSIPISPMFRCRCWGRVLSKHLRSAAAAPSSISSSSCSASISWRPHFQSNSRFEW
jgi:hypothetical protein